MKSIVAFLFVCFVAFTMAGPMPEPSGVIASYPSVLGYSQYYPYPYYNNFGTYYGYPYASYGYGNVYRSGIAPSVYQNAGHHQLQYTV